MVNEAPKPRHGWCETLRHRHGVGLSASLVACPARALPLPPWCLVLTYRTYVDYVWLFLFIVKKSFNCIIFQDRFLILCQASFISSLTNSEQKLLKATKDCVRMVWWWCHNFCFVSFFPFLYLFIPICLHFLLSIPFLFSLETVPVCCIWLVLLICLLKYIFLCVGIYFWVI